MNEVAKKTGQVVADSVLDLIGNTPLVRLNRMPGDGSAELLVKWESFNPGGSIKDRIAIHMLRKGEELGLVGPKSVVIEPTSGNTGIGLAMVCAARGYRCMIVMPDSMSLERIAMLKRFGAEVILTSARDDLSGAVRRADELAKKTPNAFVPHQFENEWNPDVHRRTTAQEILTAIAELGGTIDAFVAGVGTGGTISGVGEVLREAFPGVKIIAVEPAGSAVLSGGKPGLHKLQGIGAGFIPKTFNPSVVDETRTVKDADAFDAMKRLAAEEGILSGISAGAAVCAALAVSRELGVGKRVVTVLPDTGERYLTVEQYFEF